jgi:hypothetical protein
MKRFLYLSFAICLSFIGGCGSNQKITENVALTVTISIKNNDDKPLAHARVEHLFLYEDGMDSGSSIKVIADENGIYKMSLARGYHESDTGVPTYSVQVWVHVPGYRSERQIFQITQQQTNIEFKLDRETK